jgi:hypothetical protein
MAATTMARYDTNIETPEAYALKRATQIICFIGILLHTNVKQLQQTLPERANTTHSK